MLRTCTTLSLLLLVAAPTFAQDLRLTGQLRPRFEQRDPYMPAAPLGDVTMRARVGVNGTLPDAIGLRIEVQDVLIWGASSSTPGFSNSVEVHQAYVDIGALGAGLAARLGRQELAIGNQRLVSNNNWGQRGRRFDGARLLRGAATLPGNAFAMRLAESGTGTGADAWFHGVHAVLALLPGDSLHVYGLYNRLRGSSRTDQYTAGGHGRVTAAGVGITAEAYLQRGTRVDRDVAAWFGSLGAAAGVGRARIAIAYEHYSGDDDAVDGTARAFDRLFGSNHGFHGYADLFTDIPATTGQRGLGDALVRTRFTVDPRTDVELNGHLFRATASPAGESARFGEELDIVLRHRMRSALTLEGGGAWFRPGPAITAVRGLDRQLVFGYAMVTVSF
jgi:hypothetical protein